MARKLTGLLLLALMLGGMLASTGASLWGRKTILKGIYETYLYLEKDAESVRVRAWSAPVALSFWEADGDLAVPPKTSSGELQWADGDTCLTIAPGDWEEIPLDGAHVRGIFVRTLNAYSTYDSNATAVSLEVW